MLQNILNRLINHHQLLVKLVIILLAAYILSLLNFKNNDFEYEIEKNKSWKYNSLYAPFSFVVEKNQDEIEQEKQVISSNIIPYFKTNIIVKKRNVELVQQWNIASIDVKNAFQACIEKGIIAQEHKHNYSKIYTLNENTVSYDITNNYLTSQEAVLLVSSRFPNEKKEIVAFGNQLLPNIEIDENRTQKSLNNALSNINTFKSNVEKNELLIAKGQTISTEKYDMLLSLKKQYESEQFQSKKNTQLVKLGRFMLLLYMMSVFFVFIINYDRKTFKNINRFIFTIISFLGIMYFMFLVFSSSLLSPYLIPFCIIPIVYKNLINARVALLAHILTILMAYVLFPFSSSILIVNALAGIVAVITNVNVHYWSQFFGSIIWIFASYVVGFIGISLSKTGTFDYINTDELFWLIANVGLTLIAYPLIPFFEKMFGYTTEIRLVELSDLNNDLLKQLSLKAPGTFQHSLQVANLAEASAQAIKANGMLTKVGCLYHDIGKIENPLYFAENRKNDYNPHDDLLAEQSAAIIKSHVARGIALAKKNNLPDDVIDFIRTHHGSTRIEFFYQKALRNKDDLINENNYRYDGPLPFSKETAIVMIADAVEASARSLKVYNEQSISELVEKIINQKISDNQFVNSNISFKELTIVKKEIKKMLNGIYHVRIAYPE